MAGREQPGVMIVAAGAAFLLNGAIFYLVLTGSQAKAGSKVVDPPVMEAFVASEPLVAKGVEAPKKHLPRLVTAPPLPEESVALTTKDVAPDPLKRPKPPTEKVEKPFDAPRMRSLDDALARHSDRVGRPTPAIGNPQGSELGTATHGRLAKGYGDRVASFIGRAWGPPKFLTEDVLKATVTFVVVTIDAEGNIIANTKADSKNRDFNESIETFFGANQRLPKPSVLEWAAIKAKSQGKLRICFAERQFRHQLCY